MGQGGLGRLRKGKNEFSGSKSQWQDISHAYILKLTFWFWFDCLGWHLNGLGRPWIAKSVFRVQIWVQRPKMIHGRCIKNWRCKIKIRLFLAGGLGFDKCRISLHKIYVQHKRGFIAKKWVAYLKNEWRKSLREVGQTAIPRSRPPTWLPTYACAITSVQSDTEKT